MANEIDVTELPIKMWRGDTQLYYHTSNLLNHRLDDSSALQATNAFDDQTQMVTISHSGSTRRYFKVQDDTSAITVDGAQPIKGGQTVDVQVKGGQRVVLGLL